MRIFRKLWHKGREISDFIRPMSIPLHSAYTCFFLVLSLFPGLLLLLGVLRYTSIEVRDLTDLLEGFLPDSLMPAVTPLVESSYRHSSGTVVSISVIAMLISASRGMYGIRNGLDAVYGTTQARSYLRRRSISVLYNSLFVLVLLLTLVLYLLSNSILDFLWMTTNPPLMLVMSLVDLRMIVLLVLQTAIFTFMYALLPDRRNRLRDSLPGALFSSVGWLLFSQLFTIYVEYFTDYTNIYGSVYALALGMLWLYFCISIFFCGGALNRYLALRRSPADT